MIPARLQWPVGLGLLAVAAALPFVFGDFTVNRILTRALILGIAAASLTFLASLGGGVSLAQTGMYGLSGFMFGNLVEADGGLPIALGLWPSVLLALAVTLLVGLVIGAISSRSEGIYFLMITLAFGVIIKLLFEKATELSGFGGINQIVEPGFVDPRLHGPARFFWLCLLVSALVYLGVRYVARSPFGMAYQGNRDNPTRMRALGYNVGVLRTVAFGVGALIAGLAGILNVWWDSAIAPGAIDIGPIIYLLLIAIIGGLYRIEGAWIGALIFAILDNELRNIDLVGERVATAIGIVFLLIVLLSPGGVMGIYESIGRRLRASRPSGGAGMPGEGAAAGAAGD